MINVLRCCSPVLFTSIGLLFAAGMHYSAGQTGPASGSSAPRWDVVADVPLEPLGSLTLSANGAVLASATWPGAGTKIESSRITLWDMREGTALAIREDSASVVNDLALSPGGYWLAAGKRDKTIQLYEAGLARPSRSLKSHEAEITAVAFSPDFRWLASAAADGGVLLWDTTSWTWEKALLGHSANTRIRDVGFTGGSSVVTSLGWEPIPGAPFNSRSVIRGYGLTPRNQGKAQIIIDPASGRQITLVEGGAWQVDPGQDPICFAHSPDPRGPTAIAGGSKDPIIRLSAFGKVQELRGHSGEITSLAFSQDGQQLASGSADRTLRIWNVASATEQRVLKGHTDTIRGVAFDPEGRWLVSASLDGSLRLWNPSTGELLGSLYSFPDDEWLVVTPSGLFDGLPAAAALISLKSPSGPKAIRLDSLYATHYRPGLLKRLLLGDAPSAPVEPTLKPLEVRLTQIPLPPSRREQSFANIKVEVMGAASAVRLYRNGVAVTSFRAPKASPLGLWTSTALAALSRGDNNFVAYASDAHGNSFASTSLTVTGLQSQASMGTAYILTVGPAAYPQMPPQFKSGADDAKAFGDAMQAALTASGGFDKIVLVPLLDAEANRTNIQLALERLSRKEAAPPSGGRSRQPAVSSPAPLPVVLSEIRSAGPDDLVFIYFAGMGASLGPRHYLLFPEAGGTEAVRPEGQSYVAPASAVSDLDLLKALEEVDARRIVLVLDLTISAAGDRRPPMESAGLAQLAREKGLVLLTGAQGLRAAKTHGRFLTVALRHVLEKGAPDLSPRDGLLSLTEWFRQAAIFVPDMQQRDMTSKGAAKDMVIVDGEENLAADKRSYLRPRIFLPRSSESAQLVVGKKAPG